MRKFTKLYNMISREWTGNGSGMDRVKSRITSTKPVLTMLALLMVALFGVNVEACGECTLISGGSGSTNTKNSGTTVYDTQNFTNNDGDALTISYTCTIGTTAGNLIITDWGSNVKVEAYYKGGWHEITTLSYGRTNQNQPRSHTLSGDAKTLTQVRFKTTDGTKLKYNYSISDFKVVREGSLNVSLSTKDLGNTNIDATSSQKITISAYNLSGTPTASFLTGADAAFSKSNITANNGDCPKTWDITVSYNPTCDNTSTYTQKKCTLRVTMDGITKDVEVKATPTLRSQTVNWELGKATSLVAGTSLDVAGFATSTSDIDGKPAIYYTSSDETVIDIDEDGHTLIANEEKAGFSATITAHQDADCKYGEATADQVFTVTAKDRPEFTLYIGGVATEATSANLKVGDVVEIHYANAPNLQVSGGSSTTFTHSKNTTSKIVTVTAQGVCTNGELTLYESGNTYVEAREATFTFNISKHETDLSSLLEVNNFYVGNSVYAATAHDFENGTAYNTNNTEVDVQFSSTNENVINIVDGKIKAKAAGDATIKMWQEPNNKWTGDTVTHAITVNKHSATFTWNVAANYTWNQSVSNPFTTDNLDTEITCVSDDTNVADYVDGKVVIYNVTGTAHFTLHQTDNDVWKETEQKYTVNVTKVNKHVPFALNQTLYNTLKDDNKSSGSYSWNGGIKIESGGFDWDDKYVVIGPFEGVPYQLTCDYSCDDYSTGREWEIFESSNGSSWGSAILSESSAGTCTNKELKASTRYLKFVWSGNLNGYFSNISVSERREVKPHESADVDCGTANHGSNPTEVKAILEWYNVKPLTCWITSDHPEAFELVTTSINSRLDTCKKNEEIVVRGKHDVPADTYTGTLHVSNGIESTTFNLTTTTTKQTPSIVWKNELSPMSVGDVVADAASAGSATVHYTVDGTYLSLNDQGAVVAENATDENGVDLIAYVEEDETWKAASETIKVVITNLQKQTITWTDKLSFKFTGTKVIDLTATSSSGVEITYELSGTGNYATLDNANKKLTVTGIGSSLYLTAKTVDNAEYYPAARTKTINSRDPNASCASHVLYEDKEEKTLHTIDWEEISWDLEEGAPGVISFRIKRMIGAAGNMALEEWYDNDWHRVETYSVSTTYATKTETLSRKATKARIGAPFGATLQHYVDDIVLYQAKYCELSKTKLDFGTVTMGTAPTMSFTVHYSNLEKSLDIELENENTQFSVDKTYIGDDCGEHGTVTVTVTYNAANYVEGESTNLVISNTEYTKKVSLKALVQRASQTITWNPDLALNTTDVVAFDAVTTDAAAASGVVVKYEVTEGSDVATVTEDGQLTIIKNGTVKVKAYAEGNSQYEDATDVVKTFTISKVTPTITKNPTINAITLPATLNDVAIGLDATAEDDKGTTVTGTFAWQTGTTKVLSDAHEYAIVFTPNQPTGKDWYNEVVYNISVTGNKGDQSITWTRDNVTSQPCSTPTTFDAYSNKGLPISYVSDHEEIAHVEKVGEEYHLIVTTSGTVQITAQQAGNGDYNAAEDVTKTITLTKEQPVIVTPPTADEIFTDNLLKEAGLSGGEGQVNGVHAEGIFAWKNGDIQPEYGVHSYTATFTPSPAAWYYPAECQVSVTVNKHPHSLSWDYAGGTIYVDKNDLYFGGATSSVELDNIYYTTSNAAVAEVDAEQGNKLIIHGKGTIEVIARSEGNSNYYAAEQRRQLKILPLTTTVAANPAAAEAITYGQALSATTVIGGTVKGSDDVVLTGTWSWNNGAEVLNAGQNQSRGVTFTPNDSHWYATVAANATVNVNKADPEATADAIEISYGSTASSVTLLGTTNGTWSWNDSRANEVLNADNYALAVQFAPNDATNYNMLNTTVALTVNPATPDLTWTKAPTACLTTDANVVYAAASEASTGAISYEIVSGTCASIDANTGVLSIGAAGSITVKATLAATQNYIEKSITTVLVINAPNEFSGNGDWNDPNNWSSGEVPAESEPDIIVSGELVVDSEVTVGSLTIQPNGGVTIVDDGKLTVTGESSDIPEYGDIHVTDDGALELENSARLEVRNFMLDAKLGDNTNANPASSGQVEGAEKLNVNGDVYFQMTFDPSGQITYGWYDFVVPFEVEVMNGVYDEHFNKITYGVDYIVMNYDEQKRAVKGKDWNEFRGVMQPGRIYTITFEETIVWNTFIFKKKAGSTTLSDGSFAAEYSTVGQNVDRGWNGLGNGTLQHRELSGLADGTLVQMYNHTLNSYEPFEADEKAYAVGTAFFLQVDQNVSSIDLEETDGTKALRAPRKEANTTDKFRLSIASEEANSHSDRLWVSANEEATGEYVIGRDVLKMGTPTNAKSIQIWAISNDLRLCNIDMPMANDAASCALGIFAPQTGSYELAIERAPKDADLYLTYNENVIWDLTASPYTFDLSKGTTTGYGLRMEVKKTPQVTTGVENGELLNGENGVRKVIIDNKMYIITPEGAMYDVVGKCVKY